MSDQPSCATCRFHRPVTLRGTPEDQRTLEYIGRGNWGECRQSGPIALFGSGLASWPITADGDWCGDWRATKAAEPDATRPVRIQYLYDLIGQWAPTVKTDREWKLIHALSMAWPTVDWELPSFFSIPPEGREPLEEPS